MQFQDLALPHLATAMDVSAMREQFGRHLRAACPALEWEPTQCVIERVYYRPAHHCGILYRLTLRHFSGRYADEWFFGRMLPPNGGSDQLERIGRGIKPVHGSHEFLRPVSPLAVWHGLNMNLWIFPQDPKIRTLSYLTDPEFVRQQFEANLPALGFGQNGSPDGPRDWRCTKLTYDRVKYMPGKRCVLRFHLNADTPGGESRRMTFYSKTYSDGWSAYHFAMTKSIFEQLAAQGSEVNLPKPLLHLHGFNTYWQAEWPGDALIDVLADQNWEELFPRIAAMIASLHRSRVEGLRPGPEPDDVLNTAIEDGATLVHLLPQFQPFVQTVLDDLQVEKSMMTRQTIRAVPIHGACRVEQMLVRNTELALVDFDAVSNGDPYYDLAEFIASLQYLEISRELSRTRLERAAELFYQHYCELVPGFHRDDRRLAWYARAFLITKMLSSIKNLDLQALQRLEHAGCDLISGERAKSNYPSVIN
ncbi:MAG: phosphotransferase [bacterium]